MSMMILFPLTFLSNAFVPGRPPCRGWLAGLREGQPGLAPGVGHARPGQPRRGQRRGGLDAARGPGGDRDLRAAVGAQLPAAPAKMQPLSWAAAPPAGRPPRAGPAAGGRRYSASSSVEQAGRGFLGRRARSAPTASWGPCGCRRTGRPARAAATRPRPARPGEQAPRAEREQQQPRGRVVELRVSGAEYPERARPGRSRNSACPCAVVVARRVAGMRAQRHATSPNSTHGSSPVRVTPGSRISRIRAAHSR